MPYCFAADFIPDRHVYKKIKTLIEYATRHDCILYASDTHTPQGYSRKRFLIRVSSLENANDFIASARTDTESQLLNWYAISEVDFAEETQINGRPKRSLQDMRYKSNLNSNLIKLVETWATLSNYNTKLGEVLSHSIACYQNATHVVNENTVAFLLELMQTVSGLGIGQNFRLVRIGRNAENLYTLYIAIRCFSEAELREFFDPFDDQLLPDETSKPDDFLNSKEIGFWLRSEHFYSQLNEMINSNKRATATFEE